MTKRNLLICGGVVYVVLIAAVAWALLDARSRMIAAYATPAAQKDWEAFDGAMDERFHEQEELREELARRSGQPIQPQPPKTRSDRPPTLELLENHFAACLAVSVAGVTLLFAVVWGLFVGAVTRPGRCYVDAEPAGDTEGVSADVTADVTAASSPASTS